MLSSELPVSSALAFRSEVEAQGFAIVKGVLSADEQRDLLSALGPMAGAGRRGLLGFPPVAQVASSARLLEIVRPHLPREPAAARAIYFDKSAEANWLVPWHQDLTLAVRAQVDAPGFGPWSIKDGMPHCQAPVELLEQMLTIRLHLDDADEANGALRVIPGSHRCGRLSPEQIREMRAQHPETLCAASAGDALLMRPLLLHASSRSTSPSHRRVLHLEYVAFALPCGLQWSERMSSV